MGWTVAASIFTFLHVALFGLSIMEIIASGRLLLASDGYYIGGIYAGLICMITALLGLFSLFDGGYKHFTFVAFAVLNVVSFIVSIIATALISQLSIGLGNLSSCSYYDPSPSTTLQCQSDVNNLSCIGYSNTFIYATTCAIYAQPQYKDLPPFYAANSYDIAPAPGKCWCVGNDANEYAECLVYRQVPHCQNLFSKYPHLVDDCFVFAFPLIILTAMLFCFRDPRVVELTPRYQNPLDQEGVQGIPLVTTNGTRVTRDPWGLSGATSANVMMVAADTRVNADIVPATVEIRPKYPTIRQQTIAIAETDIILDPSAADSADSALTTTTVLADVEEEASHSTARTANERVLSSSSSQIIVSIDDNGDIWVAHNDNYNSNNNNNIYNNNSAHNSGGSDENDDLENGRNESAGQTRRRWWGLSNLLQGSRPQGHRHHLVPNPTENRSRSVDHADSNGHYHDNGRNSDTNNPATIDSSHNNATNNEEKQSVEI